MFLKHFLRLQERSLPISIDCMICFDFDERFRSYKCCTKGELLRVYAIYLICTQIVQKFKVLQGRAFKTFLKTYTLIYLSMLKRKTNLGSDVD